MNKIFHFTNIAPHYRASLWAKLLNDHNGEFHFFFDSNLNFGIQSIDFTAEAFLEHQRRLHSLKNYRLSNKIIFWQNCVIGQSLKSKFSQAIFLGDMYCLSTWVAVTICRLRGIEVTFWGHGLYGKEGTLKSFIRKTFYRLANKHLLYERRAKSLMAKQGFNPEKLYVVFNSLDYDKHKILRENYRSLSKRDVYPLLSNPNLPTLVFIGRLTSTKKLDMLLNVANSMNKDKNSVNLVFIGDGPERAKLEKLGQHGINEKWLHFVGACYSEDEIGKYLSVSDLCVSPGNVGLTAIHSLSFGTPVCTHGNLANQMPEAEAIIDGYNGFYFKENDLSDLESGIKKWFLNNTEKDQVRDRCFEIIDKYYNPDYQLTVFTRAVRNEPPEL